ncbi:sensor histidine kinase [Diaphorobacter sp.]|uniref:sensor histidine kinase n=1 Tax=Diaphorobacter sp. TaxID=1934310 RepID=UPI003D120A81
MFRTHPPAYALACVALWLMQMAVGLLLVFYAEHFSPAALQHWQTFSLVTTVVLGVLLLVQLPRALQWRPRRSVRPSPELIAERQRIARDLHDQVGSQLVSAMVLVDVRNPAMQPLAQALEHCLLDLRLLVDSMDGDDDSLTDRLARLRHRIQPALDHRGIALNWDVMPADETGMPKGAAARELTAIVQEAVSNALQHSGGTALSIRLQQVQTGQGAAWRLQVTDNGTGVHTPDVPAGAPPSGHRAGHGLAGMRQRAARAGGVLELIRPQGQGLCVQVTLPASR